MTIRALVFDIGGVLELTPHTGRAEKKWEALLQLPPGAIHQRLEPRWLAGGLGQCSEADVLAGLQTVIGMTPAQAAAYWADAWQDYLGELNVALVAWVRTLRPRYQTAILSNSFVGARERETARYHFDELVDLLIYSHEVGLSKPDPAIFALTAAHLGRQPYELLFLDDVPVMVEGARACGWHAVQFHDTPQAIAELQAYLA